jgi:DNA-binding NarL/FixJ family response regulator
VISVLLADDHPVVRAGVRGMLTGEPDIQVVGEADDGESACELATSLRPQVVLMDLSMPRLDGAAATARIRATLPGTQVVVLSTYDDEADLQRAITAGAIGYLLKDASRAFLLQAVRAAARGESVLTPAIAARLLAAARRPPEPDHELSPREREVLAVAARGLSNKEIALELAIGEATVKTHLLHAFAKLQVQDRTAAVLRAMELGLLPRP